MTQPAGLLRGMFAGLALITAAPLVANVKAGVDAWTRGDFAAAVAAWQEPAAKGDADAQFNLGQAYKLGRGVKQDMVRAEELFAKAASQGHLQASDNYGLMLFQRGERAKALPFVSAAADRGDPRAQYLLGIAHFNGDTVAKDWVRAYALMSLAQQAGLPQAPPALAQMDQHIPVSDRQKSVSLAQEIAAQAEATRARQLASADLGNTVPGGPRPAAAQPGYAPAPAPAPAVAAANPAPAPVRESPGNAGADYAKPRPAVAAAAPKPAKPAKPPVAAPIAAPRPAPPVASGGSWRIQLGAFGVTANADALWNKVRSRPELAGRTKHMVPGGAVTRLQAGGFASEAAARSACTRLSAAGIGCIAVGG